MADIAPELYNRIKEIFDEKYAAAQLLGGPISDTLAKINSGDATIIDANLFASEVGGMMADAMKEVLVLEDLPGGRLYRNIAQKTIGEGLKDTYGIMSQITRTIQEEINAANKIGLKAVQPKLETSRVDKIVDKAAAAKTQEALDNVIDNNVPTFTRQVVDDSQKANARMHNKAGLKVTVEREYDGVGLHDGTDVCDWCLQRAGTWTYDKALANGVFERHEGCGCIITYTSRKGERTVSDSKYGGWERQEDREARIAREQEIMNSLATNDRSNGYYMASSRKDEFGFSPPIKHSREEIQELEKYATEHGFRIQAPQNFTGDSKILKEQIDVLYSLCQEYGYNKEIVLSFEGMDRSTLARTSLRGGIVFNSEALRSREIINNFLNEDNELAASDIRGVAAHEFGHLLTREYGNESLEIAREAYYNIYGKTLSDAELLKELKAELSDYAIDYNQKTGKYEELLPEVLGKHVTKQDIFTTEFSRITKGRWLL